MTAPRSKILFDVQRSILVDFHKVCPIRCIRASPVIADRICCQKPSSSSVSSPISNTYFWVIIVDPRGKTRLKWVSRGRNIDYRDILLIGTLHPNRILSWTYLVPRYTTRVETCKLMCFLPDTDSISPNIWENVGRETVKILKIRKFEFLWMRKNCKIQKNPTMNAKNPDPGGFFGCIAILLACFWGYPVFRGQFDNLVVDYS